MELELINLKLKFPTKNLNPQINLPFNFFIQKYFFHENPNWNINYSEQILRVPTHCKKQQLKNGIDKFDLTKWN